MKKLSGLLLVLAMLVLMAPAVKTYAAPEGFVEVQLNKKNFKKFFGVKKLIQTNDAGAYDGYEFHFVNKFRSKGYYVFNYNLAVKYKVTHRYKFRQGKKWRKTKDVLTNKTSYLGTSLAEGDDRYNYKYAKLRNLKFKKIKGTMVFVHPSNVIGVEKIQQKGGSPFYRIKLKLPYDSSTDHENGINPTTGKSELLYYYFDVYNLWEL